MDSDENLGSFTSVESSGSGGSGLFIPTAIALTGVLLGGIALYLAFAGSGKTGETQAALTAATEQTQALETRMATLEETIAKLSDEMNTQDTRLRSLASQTQTALNKVGVELNASREQLTQTADKVAEISEKLAAANSAPRPVTIPSTNLSSSSSPEVIEGNTPATGSAAPGLREHTIASGETFAKLASMYNVTVDAILSSNPDADPRRLQVGQKIKIPRNDHERE